MPSKHNTRGLSKRLMTLFRGPCRCYSRKAQALVAPGPSAHATQGCPLQVSCRSNNNHKVNKAEIRHARQDTKSQDTRRCLSFVYAMCNGLLLHTTPWICVEKSVGLHSTNNFVVPRYFFSSRSSPARTPVPSSSHALQDRQCPLVPLTAPLAF